MKRSISACAAAVLSALGGSAMAATITVSQFQPASPTPAAGTWYLSDVRTGGTASIVDLTGAGGNLESGQPLPTGAAKLTTDMTNAAKAEVGMSSDLGLASTALQNIVLGYSYYKQAVSGGNAFAAPTLKLQIYAAGNYGSLVYEPTWNLGAGSAAVPTNAWRSVSIDSSTGAGDSSTGGWWWSGGGFNVSGSGGGTPIRSLSEWVTVFQAADPTDFANAHIVGLSVGVGTYNQGQVGYFDRVSYQANSGSEATVYDFGPAAAGELPSVPLPSAAWAGMALLGALVGTKGLKRLRRQPA